MGKKLLTVLRGGFAALVFTMPMALMAQSLSVIHSFDAASSVDVRDLTPGPDGAFYGTTANGGDFGLGSIFKVYPDGSGFTNVFSFSSSMGYQPYGGVVLLSNVLYGTTSGGGSGSLGTLFRVNADGTDYTNLHEFPDSIYYPPPIVIDGFTPYAGLTLSGNTLFGTTQFGGSGSFGTVFKINTDGTGYQVLVNFDTSFRTPQGPLLLSGDTLYGTTFYGGVFKVDTNGKNYAVIANVPGQLYCGLVLQSNVLYGTTEKGTNMWGSVFSVNTDGTDFTNLHNFTATDGETPEAGLVLVGNTLYGTTIYGGNASYGVVYKINTDGSGFQDLYQFQGQDDGLQPNTALLYSTGTLYGGTFSGIVYSLSLAAKKLPLAIHATPGGLSVVWPSGSAYTLQESTDLVHWTNYSGAPTDDGTNESVSLGSPTGKGYYRLSDTSTNL